jgi:hypothetical protein
MEIRRRVRKTKGGQGRVHIWLDARHRADLLWLAQKYDDGNVSGTVRQLIADQMEREIEAGDRQ